MTALTLTAIFVAWHVAGAKLYIYAANKWGVSPQDSVRVSVQFGEAVGTYLVHAFGRTAAVGLMGLLVGLGGCWWNLYGLYRAVKEQE